VIGAGCVQQESTRLLQEKLFPFWLKLHMATENTFKPSVGTKQIMIKREVFFVEKRNRIDNVFTA
jgi:hypothetical protein